MKNLILIAICFVSLQLSAQGNLQFNQVINGEIIAMIPTTAAAIGSITVPAGKVWKIETVSLISSTMPNLWESASQNNQVYIDNLAVYHGSIYIKKTPVWLSEGTHPVKARSVSNQNYSFSYSAIEFNIVP